MTERDDPDVKDVPILGELEVEFTRLVAERLEEDARAATAPPAPGRRGRVRGERLRTGRRIARRAALAGALLGVVGASALAARSVVSGGPAGDASVVLRRDAATGVTLRRYHGSLCLDIEYAGGVATHCTRPPGRAGAVAALSAVTPAGRVVAGVAGRRVAAVRLGADGQAATARTADAGDGHGTRWFTAVLPHAPDRHRPTAAVLTPLGAGGAAAGPSVADCSLGTAASCRAATMRAGTLTRAPVNRR